MAYLMYLERIGFSKKLTYYIAHFNHEGRHFTASVSAEDDTTVFRRELLSRFNKWLETAGPFDDNIRQMDIYLP